MKGRVNNKKTQYS